MSDTPDPKLNGQRQPFRKAVTWGRPPETVFRAGPLPEGGTLPPLPEPPRPATRPAGILSGSLVPRAAPAAPSSPARSQVTQSVATPPRPAEPRPTPANPVTADPVMAEPVVAESVAARPDLTVRPLPTPDPVSDPAPFPEADARPAGPVEAAPMVSPALAAASGRRKSSGRLPLYAGGALAALAAVAGAVWLLNRPDAVPPAPPVVAEAPTTLDALPAAPVAAIPDEGAPVEAASEPVPPVAEVAAAPVVVAPRAAPSPAPASAGPTPRPAPAQAQAAPTPVPPAIAPAPLVEIAPVRPAGPPPTAAERPTADPDAPIATRPQPLDQDD